MSAVPSHAFVYDVCKTCKQNISGTGKSVYYYIGSDSLSHCNVEKILYKKHPRLDAIEERIIDWIDSNRWFWPTCYLAVGVFGIYTLVSGWLR